LIYIPRFETYLKWHIKDPNLKSQKTNSKQISIIKIPNPFMIMEKKIPNLIQALVVGI